MGSFRRLLERGQRAAALRADVDMADVKALLEGCLARKRDAADASARDRMIAIVGHGLRTDRV
jgi:hypothetical protein